MTQTISKLPITALDVRGLQHRGMAQRLAEQSEDMILNANEAEDLADLIQSHILEGPETGSRDRAPPDAPRAPHERGSGTGTSCR